MSTDYGNVVSLDEKLLQRCASSLRPPDLQAVSQDPEFCFQESMRMVAVMTPLSSLSMTELGKEFRNPH